MTFLLDTNSCIEFLRHGPSTPLALRLAATVPDELALCSVVLAELLYGAHRSARPPQSLSQVRAFCAPFQSLPFDDRAAEAYGLLRSTLATQGNVIGPNDLMIAAICLVHGFTLVTNNTAEFGRVAGLAIEDWTRP